MKGLSNKFLTLSGTHTQYKQYTPANVLFPKRNHKDLTIRFTIFIVPRFVYLYGEVRKCYSKNIPIAAITTIQHSTSIT